MIEINPLIWFVDRELDTAPQHFIKCSTPIKTESLFWVRSKLSGRFAVENSLSIGHSLVIDHHSFIYFEDSKDAMLYELRWSGAK